MHPASSAKLHTKPTKSKLEQLDKPLEMFPVEERHVRESISEAVPKKTIEQNLKAFDLGRKNAHDSLCTLVPCTHAP
jgi:hypothetical protein